MSAYRLVLEKGKRPADLRRRRASLTHGGS
jgi:hypothetical protein